MKQELQTIVLSPQEEIKALLLRLKLLKAKKDIICSPLMQEFIELQEKLNEKQQPFNAEAGEIEQRIKELIKSVGETIKTENGQASYKKGSVRVTYDRKGLDAIEDIKIRDTIDRYRKTTESEPSIKVEVY